MSFNPCELPESCDICGSDLDWEACWQCFGEGEFDDYETNPNEYPPGATTTCDECKGAGGYLVCPVAAEGRHPKVEAIA